MNSTTQKNLTRSEQKMDYKIINGNNIDVLKQERKTMITDAFRNFVRTNHAVQAKILEVEANKLSRALHLTINEVNELKETVQKIKEHD